MIDPAAVNRATYDAIAPDYAARFGHSSPWGEVLARFVASLPRHAVVADLGCGPGRDLKLLRAAGCRVVGIDLSLGMLAQGTGPRVQADLRDLPLPDASLDGIWCCASLLHLPISDTARTVGEMRRVLRPGGALTIITAIGTGEHAEPVAYAPDNVRWYVYRQPGHVRAALDGFEVIDEAEHVSSRHWYVVRAHRSAAS